MNSSGMNTATGTWNSPRPPSKSASEEDQATTRNTLLTVLETCLRTLHPIMPFITEEIWQRVKTPLEIEGESIMLQRFPMRRPAG